MPLQTFLTAIEESSVGIAMRESAWLFPAVECVHIIGLAVLFGSILVVDLRLLGLASRKRSVKALSKDILPWTWASFLVCAITGPILFAAHAVDYFAQHHFQMKFLFMVLAGVNMLIFQLVTFRNVEAWGHNPSPPFAAKLSGGLSVIFWIMVVGYGRWVGFHYD